MKWIIYILIIVAVVVIDQSLFNVFDLGRYTPDLLLLLVLATVWSFNNYDFLIFAGFGGFWLETLSGFPVGSLVLGLIITGSLAYILINRWLFSEKPWQYFFGAIVIGTILIHVWMWLYTSVLVIFQWSHVTVSGQDMLRGLIPALLINILFTYPILIIIESLAKLTQRSGGGVGSQSIYKF
jgi:cell shape-determining protein MreD